MLLWGRPGLVCLSACSAKMNSSSLEVPPSRTDVLERKGGVRETPRMPQPNHAFGGRKGLGRASNCTHPASAWGACSRGALMLWTASPPPTPLPRRLSLVWSSAARRGWVGLRRSSWITAREALQRPISSPRSSSEFIWVSTPPPQYLIPRAQPPPLRSPSGSRRTGCPSLCRKAAPPPPGPDRRGTVAVESTLREFCIPQARRRRGELQRLAGRPSEAAAWP